jgi:DMSO reductase family type II enzyme chaperone
MFARPGTPIPSDPVAPSPPLPAADVALCRSALWEALALGLRAPTAETVARLARLDGAEALAAAAAVVDDVQGSDVTALVRALGTDPPPSLAELQAAHGRLFGHTARGPVPPYETEYGEDSQFQPQREMSDLAAFFRAFGLVRRPDGRERPDHVACQCEFMLVLARKEAHALDVADTPMLEATRRAARLFLRDHLGRWAPAFGGMLAREDPGGFYGALGRLCAEFVTSECRRAGVPAGPALLRLRSADMAGVPMGCDAGPQASDEVC